MHYDNYELIYFRILFHRSSKLILYKEIVLNYVAVYSYEIIFKVLNTLTQSLSLTFWLLLVCAK